MGLGQRKRGGNISAFLKFHQGDIVREWRKSKPEDSELLLKEDGTPFDLLEREIEKGKNKGNTVWYQTIPSIEGHIKEIKLSDSDFGETINVKIDADIDGTFVLSFGTENVYGRSFVNKALNLDLSLPVSFEPGKGHDNEKDRDFIYLVLRQEEEKVENFHNKDDVPDWKVVEDRKGNFKEFDKTDSDNYLLEHFEKWLSKHFSLEKDDDSEPVTKQEASLKAQTTGAKKAPKKTATKKKATPAPAEKDDLPF